ncbi:MAG: ComEA family DNA-binding protein [Phycisphaeraceae bacterium]
MSMWTPVNALVVALALLWTGAAVRVWQAPPTHAARDGVALEYRLDVNAADAATLQLLPGIGPGLAARVVERREREGAFATAADLQRVSQVGPVTVQALEPWVRFGPAER